MAAKLLPRILGAGLLCLLSACAGPSSISFDAGLSSASTTNPSPPCGTAATATVLNVLAPTGALRVGVYSGSPSSYIAAVQGEPARGVGYLLGEALASKLGVPFQPVVFPANAPLLAALVRGEVDVVFTNATAERARSMDFTPTVLDVRKSVLVPAESPFASLDDLRGRGVLIGVSAGSSTGAELAQVYSDVRLQPVPTLGQAAAELSRGGIQGFATNNAILYELSEQVPGSRVLPGAWGLEQFALGIPRGREAGREFMAKFAQDAVRSGLIRRAVQQSRLRGSVQ